MNGCHISSQESTVTSLQRAKQPLWTEFILRELRDPPRLRERRDRLSQICLCLTKTVYRYLRSLSWIYVYNLYVFNGTWKNSRNSISECLFFSIHPQKLLSSPPSSPSPYSSMKHNLWNTSYSLHACDRLIKLTDNNLARQSQTCSSTRCSHHWLPKIVRCQ